MWKIWLMISLLITNSLSQKFQDEDEKYRVLDRKKAYPKVKKYINCQVCNMAAQSIYRIWLMSMNDAKFDENELYNLVVETCNPWSNIGVWITAMHLTVHKNNSLELVNKEDMGECNRVCETIKASCTDVVLSQSDEIAEFIWTKKDEMDNPKLTEFMCPDVCSNGLYPVAPKKIIKKHKLGQEEWVQMSKDEKQKRLDFFRQQVDEGKIKSEL